MEADSFAFINSTIKIRIHAEKNAFKKKHMKMS